MAVRSRSFGAGGRRVPLWPWLLLGCWVLFGLLPGAALAMRPSEPQVRVLEDVSGRLDEAEARASTHWRPLPPGAPNLGYSDSVWWFDLRWDPPPAGER